MNKLELFIQKNKTQFEEEPAAGHFDRLQQKMNRKSRRIVALRWSISIAASVAFVFLIGMIWQHTGKQNNQLFICESALDMKACYLDRMNAVAVDIEALSKDLDQWDRQQVLTDVQNIIDVASSDLDIEIPVELPKERAKAILSDYYRQNLESLEMIVEELKVEKYELKL